MAKYVGYKRPKDTKKTVKHLLSYLGHYKWAFLLIAILVFISAGAGIMGTFLIKPVVNNFIVPGNMKGLIIAVCGMGVMYACGALSTLGYNRLMVHTSQKVVSEIRMDLFKHTQKLPLKYFDNNKILLSFLIFYIKFHSLCYMISPKVGPLFGQSRIHI